MKRLTEKIFAEQLAIPRSCSHFAHYKELRSKPVLTVVGPVEFQRPYYVCARRHHAPNPTDAALGVEQREFSPGVRRVIAVVGSGSPFDLGREQLELLTGLPVSAKSVERQAEQIGAEIMRLEQAEIRRSVQLQLPIPMGLPIPVFYVEIDGTGIPAVRKETQGRIGKVEGQPADQFPGAILIVDFYHASEPLHQLSRSLFPSDDAARRGWAPTGAGSQPSETAAAFGQGLTRSIWHDIVNRR